MKMSHIFGAQKVCKPFARLYKTVFDISVRKISSPTRVPVREMSESKYEQIICSDFYRKLHDVEKKIYYLFTYLESDTSFSGHQNTPCKARLH